MRTSKLESKPNATRKLLRMLPVFALSPFLAACPGQTTVSVGTEDQASLCGVADPFPWSSHDTVPSQNWAIGYNCIGVRLQCPKFLQTMHAVAGKIPNECLKPAP